MKCVDRKGKSARGQADAQRKGDDLSHTRIQACDQLNRRTEGAREFVHALLLAPSKRRPEQQRPGDGAPATTPDIAGF